MPPPIRGRRRPICAWSRVTDTGTGMPPEVIGARLRSVLHHQGGRARAPGLGLSQVLRLRQAVAAGTSRSIRSSARARRSRSTCRASPAPNAEPGSRAASRRRAADARTAAKSILVVEDDDRRAPASRSMPCASSATRVAPGRRTRQQALAAARTRSRAIELLFTDIVMPDMNGRQLAEKAPTRRPELKVLFTTGYTRNAVVHNGMLDPDVALPGQALHGRAARPQGPREVLDESAASRPRGY